MAVAIVAGLSPLGICIYILCGLSQLVLAYEVVLLDTTKEPALNWVTRSAGHKRQGWREASYTSGNDVYRVYTVCNVANTGVTNWLRMPYIERGEAKRLYIEMKFTMRKCTKYPNPESLQQCMESFQLYYFEAESDFANEELPSWDTAVYRHVDVVAADSTFEETDQATTNVEARSIRISRRGVYFAFYDTGACTTLLSIKVYYIMCPSVIVNFAIFPNTTTGPQAASVELTNGECVPHAAIEESPKYMCQSDGSWTYSSGGCKCLPGYEPANGDQACHACPPGKYKWKTGSTECNPCPANSQALKEASVECTCKDKYYRNMRDKKSMPCTRPPSSIRNLRIEKVDHATAWLTWQPPEDLGGRRDLSYNVFCSECDRLVKFEPKKSGFNQTRVTLQNLKPSTNYTVRIYAENGVSRLSQEDRYKHIVFRTEASVPTKVQNLKYTGLTPNTIEMVWDPPREAHTPVDVYELMYYAARYPKNKTAIQTKYHNMTLQSLEPKTTYYIQVRGKNHKGWGEYSSSIHATTFANGHSENNPDREPGHRKLDSPVGIIAGSAVAVVVCMLIVIIMVIIFFRRNQRHCNDKNVSDCDTLHYTHVQCVPPHLDPTQVYNGGITVPLFNTLPGIKTYVDPHTYEDPNQAVREFTKEIDSSQITIESVIGGGEFGDVCKGKLRITGRNELTVAIKTLKPGATDKNRLDFLTEASIMGQFEDPNVIYLEGVVTKNNPIMIVTEYMANGSLDTFLRNNDGKFTVIQLVGMMRGIASGMRYLAEMGYVHRDLAARNILVNENLVCKVADFGLSREIEIDNTEGAYTTKGGKIPVRWTAPEAISYRKFTSASDVWSYGVVMWEIMAYGERPYWNWSNQDVIKAVEKGYRLPPPMDCPDAIHQLMLDCWQKERNHRPKFAAIVKTLDKLIRAPELLRKIAKPRPQNLMNQGAPDLTSLTSIEEWLTSIKMERYIDHFLHNGIVSMHQVAQLMLKDIVAMGITLVGHQKKIMNSVQTLRAQIDGTHVSEGLFV